MQEVVDAVMLELLEKIPNITEAIRCCIRISGLTDKQVYFELGIDAGQWSRILNGQANFPHEKILELMKICRNDLPLFWLAKKSGYELKLSKSSFEELLKKEREEKEEIQKKLEAILEILKKAEFPVEN